MTTSKDLERRQDVAPLVERLQKCSAYDAPTWPVDHLLMREAADALTRQQAVLDKVNNEWLPAHDAMCNRLDALQAENERLAASNDRREQTIARLHETAESAERERDALKEALRELVRLKDVRDRLEARSGRWTIGDGADADEYERSKPLAWGAARALTKEP